MVMPWKGCLCWSLDTADTDHWPASRPKPGQWWYYFARRWILLTQQIKRVVRIYTNVRADQQNLNATKVDNWFLAPSQPRRSYQGDTRNQEWEELRKRSGAGGHRVGLLGLFISLRTEAYLCGFERADCTEAASLMQRKREPVPPWGSRRERKKRERANSVESTRFETWEFQTLLSVRLYVGFTWVVPTSFRLITGVGRGRL